MADNDVINEAEKEESAENDVSQGGMEHLDFITSIVLMALSVIVSIVSYGYYVKSRKAFYASPGFMPIIICAALFLLGLSLMLQSVKKNSVKEIFRRVLDAAPRGLTSLRFRNSVIGLAFFGIYIYVLLRFLPFWLASAVLLFVCFLFLKASKLFKIVIISVLSIGGIVLLFQVIFRVPMP
jgi:hypothetical protein